MVAVEAGINPCGCVPFAPHTGMWGHGLAGQTGLGDGGLSFGRVVGGAVTVVYSLLETSAHSCFGSSG